MSHIVVTLLLQSFIHMLEEQNYLYKYYINQLHATKL
jgi:hypothetical protein